MTRLFVVAILFVGANATAEIQIHRCLLDDGTFAFQELPCVEPADESDDHIEVGGNEATKGTDDENDDHFNFVNPFDEPPDQPESHEPLLPETISRDRGECEKTTRDAIDAIDLEMRRNPYTKEQGQAYLADLRVLTQQLRACKEL